MTYPSLAFLPKNLILGGDQINEFREKYELKFSDEKDPSLSILDISFKFKLDVYLKVSVSFPVTEDTYNLLYRAILQEKEIQNTEFQKILGLSSSVVRTRHGPVFDNFTSKVFNKIISNEVKVSEGFFIDSRYIKAVSSPDSRTGFIYEGVKLPGSLIDKIMSLVYLSLLLDVGEKYLSQIIVLVIKEYVDGVCVQIRIFYGPRRFIWIMIYPRVEALIYDDRFDFRKLLNQFGRIF